MDCVHTYQFCAKLAARTGRQITVPTAAQWGYAARVGTSNLTFAVKYQDQSRNATASRPGARAVAPDDGARHGAGASTCEGFPRGSASVTVSPAGRDALWWALARAFPTAPRGSGPGQGQDSRPPAANFHAARATNLGMRVLALILPAVLLLALTGRALARNVDLSTVPQRQTVQLTIYNSEDLTLVRETRVVSFKKGINPLQFSWANTLIDPTSVELKFLTNPDKLDVLDTTYPHDKPQMLYWNVKSELDGQVTIQITYFTSGITWSADYLAISDKDERTASFEGYVRVSNNSGEEYEDAQVRLVVGKINLVEKIAQLARLPVEQLGRLNAKELGALRVRGLKDAVDRFEDTSGSVSAATGIPATPPPKPKAIIKEGLSEYFIFTIEGTETIPTGWSKRMRSIEAAGVPLNIQYRYRPAEYGDQLVRMYLWKNDKDAKLGQAPLPDGAVRVFRQNGRDGLSYLAQQAIKYIPIGDKIELNLGPDPEVIFELLKLRAGREELWLQVGGTNTFRRVDGAMAIEVNSNIVGWDERELYTQRIRNYTAKPIEVEVRRTWPGHIVFRSNLPGLKLFDYQTPEFTVSVDPGKRLDALFEIVRHQGRNAKQTNVTLEQADVK